MQGSKWTKVRGTSMGSLPCVCKWMCLCFKFKMCCFYFTAFGFRPQTWLHWRCCAQQRITVPSANIVPLIKYSVMWVTLCFERVSGTLWPQDATHFQQWFGGLWGHCSPSRCAWGGINTCPFPGRLRTRPVHLKFLLLPWCLKIERCYLIFC